MIVLSIYDGVHGIKVLNKKTFCYKESIDECKYCFASWYFFEFYAFRQSSKQVKKYSDIAETALKDRSEITQEIASQKVRYQHWTFEYIWKSKPEKITPSVKWNMSVVYGTPKGSVYKICITEKFWLLIWWKSNNEHLMSISYWWTSVA